MGNKQRITIGIDIDVLEHFRSLAERHNEAYQTMMNQALRAAAGFAADISHVDSGLVEIVERQRREVEALQTQISQSANVWNQQQAALEKAMKEHQQVFENFAKTFGGNEALAAQLEQARTTFESSLPSRFNVSVD